MDTEQNNFVASQQHKNSVASLSKNSEFLMATTILFKIYISSPLIM